MNTVTSRVIFGIIIIAGILLHIFSTTNFLHVNHPDLGELSTIPKYLRFGISFLCALFVWTIGKDEVVKGDRFKLSMGFVLIFIADAAFFFNQELPAIGLFALAHIVLIIRNGAGFAKFIKENSLATIFRLLSPITLVIVSSLFIILHLLIILVPENMLIIQIGGKYDFIEVLPYLILVSLGWFFAWNAPRLGHFPRKNAILIAIGMTCFFLCDVSIGMSSTLDQPVFFNNIAWIFYIPALLCLGLSGRNLEKTVA